MNKIDAVSEKLGEIHANIKNIEIKLKSIDDKLEKQNGGIKEALLLIQSEKNRLDNHLTAHNTFMATIFAVTGILTGLITLVFNFFWRR